MQVKKSKIFKRIFDRGVKCMDLNIILQDTINKLNQGDSTLIILKGIKDYGLKENNVSLEKIIENKMGYFLSEIYQKKNVISYDEYLCLYPIIKGY